MQQSLLPKAPSASMDAFVRSRQKLLRLKFEDDAAVTTRSFIREESSCRERISLTWEDGANRFYTRYVGELSHLLVSAEYEARSRLVHEAHDAIGSVVSFCGRALYITGLWDDGRSDLMCSEHRGWDRIARSAKNSLRISAENVLVRIALGYRHRKLCGGELTKRALDRRIKPALVIPDRFFIESDVAAEVLKRQERAEWAQLVVLHSLDAAYWCEIAGRRAIWYERRLARCEIESERCLQTIGMLALHALHQTLSHTHYAFKHPAAMHAVPKIQRWWRRKQMPKSKEQLPVGVPQLKLFDCQEKLESMTRVLCRPSEIPMNDWELVSGLRSLERGHALGSLSLWRQYVQGFDRLADQLLCPFVPQPSTQKKEEAAVSAVKDTVVHIDSPTSAASSVLGLSRSASKSSDVFWLLSLETIARRTIVEEQRLWWKSLESFSVFECDANVGEVAVGSYSNAKLVDKMLREEQLSSLAFKEVHVSQDVPKYERSSATSETDRYFLRAAGEMAAKETAERSSLVAEETAGRLRILTMYIRNSVDFERSEARHIIVVEEEAERRKLRIANMYDLEAAKQRSNQSKREALFEEESSLRRMIARRILKELSSIPNSMASGLQVTVCQEKTLQTLSEVELRERLRETRTVLFAELGTEESLARNKLRAEASEGHVQLLWYPLLPKSSSFTVGDALELVEREMISRTSIENEYLTFCSESLLNEHIRYVTSHLWPIATHSMLVSLSNPFTSEPRRLVKAIMTSLSNYGSRIELLESLEGRERVVLEELEAHLRMDCVNM